MLCIWRILAPSVVSLITSKYQDCVCLAVCYMQELSSLKMCHACVEHVISYSYLGPKRLEETVQDRCPPTYSGRPASW